MKHNDTIKQFNLVTDRRNYRDRRDIFAIQKKAAEFVPQRPKAKIRHNTPPPEENPLRKNKGASRPKAEEHESQHVSSHQ